MNVIGASILGLFLVGSLCLTGCATIMTEQQIISETAGALGVAPNEVLILQKRPSLSKLIYTAKIKSGEEYLCQINASDVGSDKNLNPPTCVKNGGQLATQIRSNDQRSQLRSSEQQIAPFIKRTQSEILDRQIDGATPFLLDFLPRFACISGNNPGHSFMPRYTTGDSGYYYSFPTSGMKFHNNSGCLTIDSISDWKSLAKNAISFSVLFVADDSGESSRINFRLIEQSNGTWRVRF